MTIEDAEQKKACKKDCQVMSRKKLELGRNILETGAKSTSKG